MAEYSGLTTVLLAAVPLVCLLALSMVRRVPLVLTGIVVTAMTAFIAWLAFDASPLLLGMATIKGVWTGLWIALIVAPALLLYRIAAPAGLGRIGDGLGSLTTRQLETLLIVAWLLPSLFQGVAGFGAPIALVVPILMAMGYPIVKAVAYPLIGYCWSVTFGSMGSSFYMAVATAGLSGEEALATALLSATLLSVVALLGAILVVTIEGGFAGFRECLPLIACAWVPLAIGLTLAATFAPVVASVVASIAGLGGAFALQAARNRTAFSTWIRSNRTLGVLLLPYAILVALVLALALPPPVRTWTTTHLTLTAPLVDTQRGSGQWNEASAAPVFAVFAHPGTYVLVACAAALIVYRLAGLWPKGLRFGDIAAQWAGGLPRTLAPIVVLATFAAVLVDTGASEVVALGLTALVGVAYPALSPMLGALGAFTTGSSTSANALFSALQADSARAIGASVPLMVAAQTTGANIGNSFAPVIVATGMSSTSEGDTAAVIRRVLPAAGILLAAIATVVVIASAIISSAG